MLLLLTWVGKASSSIIGKVAGIANNKLQYPLSAWLDWYSNRNARFCLLQVDPALYCLQQQQCVKKKKKKIYTTKLIKEWLIKIAS